VQPELGRRLRQERLRRGLSQSDLAGDGVSASYVSLVESGKREPTPQVIEKLAERLAVDPELLRTGVSSSAADQARMDLAFAKLTLEQGDAEHAASLLDRVVADKRLDADPRLRFAARLARAEALERLGSLDQAVKELEGLRGEAQKAPSELPWLPVVLVLSRCYREAGDLQAAIDVATTALEHYEVLGLRGLDGHPQLVATLALAHFDRGDLLKAQTLLDDLLATAPAGDRIGRAAAHWNAAVVAAGRGRAGEALRLSERAAALLAENAEERLVARLKVTRAWIHLAQDPPEAGEAKRLLQAALPALQMYDSAGTVAGAEVELSKAETLLGNFVAAELAAESALQKLGGEHSLEIARARAALGGSNLAGGRLREARSNLDAAAELLEHVGAAREAAALWREIADVSIALGDTERAVAAYKKALDAAGLRGRAAVAGHAVVW
jgi:transcriptional regulator with XRE-family HTH domain